MKIIILITTLFLTTKILGQSSDSLGIDNNIELSRQEIDFLNTSLKDSRGSFDFTNKKIAFIIGSSGRSLISKQFYFKTYVKPRLEKNEPFQSALVILTPEEKLKSKGYDAFVLSWVKVVFSEKQKGRIIEELSRKTN